MYSDSGKAKTFSIVAFAGQSHVARAPDARGPPEVLVGAGALLQRGDDDVQGDAALRRGEQGALRPLLPRAAAPLRVDLERQRAGMDAPCHISLDRV